MVKDGVRALEEPGRDGEMRLYAVNALGNNGLFVVFGMPRATLMDPLLRDLLIQIGILCRGVRGRHAGGTHGRQASGDPLDR